MFVNKFIHSNPKNSPALKKLKEKKNKPNKQTKKKKKKSLSFTELPTGGGRPEGREIENTH